MQPAAGVDYPLQLGASLLGKRTAQVAGAEEYCTLRYDFKPASAGRALQGQMEVQLASQKVRRGRVGLAVGRAGGRAGWAGQTARAGGQVEGGMHCTISCRALSRCSPPLIEPASADFQPSLCPCCRLPPPCLPPVPACPCLTLPAPAGVSPNG